MPSLHNLPDLWHVLMSVLPIFCKCTESSPSSISRICEYAYSTFYKLFSQILRPPCTWIALSTTSQVDLATYTFAAPTLSSACLRSPLSTDATAAPTSAHLHSISQRLFSISWTIASFSISCLSRSERVLARCIISCCARDASQPVVYSDVAILCLIHFALLQSPSPQRTAMILGCWLPHYPKPPLCGNVLHHRILIPSSDE